MTGLGEARERAERLAEACLGGMVESRPVRWLRDECLAETHCWLFLKASELRFLPGCAESGDMAFVVSRKGKVMSVADHREDMNALRQYLKQVSEYLARTNG